MLKLQNIIYPSTDNCTEEALYFRRGGKIEYSYADDNITFGKKALISFDTYFNGFSASKWFKYTKIETLSLRLKLKGSFRVSLQYKEKQANEIMVKTLKEFYVDTGEELLDVDAEFATELNQGMFCFELLALEKNSKFFEGYYFTQINESDTSLVNLVVDICTFKREKYIYRNMKMLMASFLGSPQNDLHNHLDIVISDNAGTLDSTKIENDYINVFHNKNVGGAGGFTRGLIECINLMPKKQFTHILMMDDDVIMQPESIYRTYRFLTVLKDEYKSSYIGGAMLRTDKQWFQTEAGGSWNNGNLISHKSGLDLRSLDACLYNEYEEKCDFNAWWYCCIPMEFIKEDNLPVPIFIRGDDVEYGLRNMKNLILLNGICVWHEPFEHKYSSSMFYYILRNKLIDNSLHNSCYSEKQLISELSDSFKREVFTLRYKNARLILDGVNDFLKGIDWLKKQDGEILNTEIMNKGYKLQYIEELSIPFSYPMYENTLCFHEAKKQQIKRKLCLNGFFQKANKVVIVPTIAPHIAHLYKAGGALNYDITSKKGFVTYRSRKEMIELFLEYKKLIKEIKKSYKKVSAEYGMRKAEITNMEFWKEYLAIK